MIMAKDPEAAMKEDLQKNVELETTIISNAIIKIGIVPNGSIYSRNTGGATDINCCTGACIDVDQSRTRDWI